LSKAFLRRNTFVNPNWIPASEIFRGPFIEVFAAVSLLTSPSLNMILAMAFTKTSQGFAIGRSLDALFSI
jgi:hypothetical protein